MSKLGSLFKDTVIYGMSSIVIIHDFRGNDNGHSAKSEPSFLCKKTRDGKSVPSGCRPKAWGFAPSPT